MKTKEQKEKEKLEAARVAEIIAGKEASYAARVGEWRKKWPTGVFCLVCGEYIAWIRKPTRDEMRELTARNGEVDPVTYTEIVLDMLWLDGDAQIRDNDEVFYSIMPEVQGVLDIKQAALKKV